MISVYSVVCLLPEVSSPSIIMYLTPFTLLILLPFPFPSGYYHSAVSVSVSMLLVCFVC